MSVSPIQSSLQILSDRENGLKEDLMNLRIKLWTEADNLHRQVDNLPGTSEATTHSAQMLIIEERAHIRAMLDVQEQPFLVTAVSTPPLQTLKDYKLVLKSGFEVVDEIEKLRAGSAFPNAAAFEVAKASAQTLMKSFFDSMTDIAKLNELVPVLMSPEDSHARAYCVSNTTLSDVIPNPLTLPKPLVNPTVH
jgi:hypothetical protein